MSSRGAFINWAAVFFAFALVWLPEFEAHWASPMLVSDGEIDKGRVEPSDELLERVGRQSLGLPLVPSTGLTESPLSSEVEAAAKQVLAGTYAFPKQPPVRLAVPFDESNLTAGPPTHRLYVASLATADVLLRAYRATGGQQYLMAARDEIEAFARTDRWRLLPEGMLWNDHALAATIPVLADYWSLIRKDPDLDIAHARTVLSLVERTATRLARPKNYTFRTNHGLMQSIALVQVAAAFPYLDPEGQLKSLACERIVEQAGYYLSSEGPVLEHSAGYHMLGLQLYGILEELSPAHGCEMPPGFAGALEKARVFGSQLRRPDGSLPVFGNTDLAEKVPPSLIGTNRPEAGLGLYPGSGFAVRWHGLTGWPESPTLAQTTLTWSHYPSLAHKLADDMSVLVWAGGEDWLLNTGYWPYGGRGAGAARGWRGSNAPHWKGEAAQSSRSATLRSHADSEQAWWIELERTSGSGEARMRRQVAAVGGRLWVIVDWADSPSPRMSTTIWTLPPDKEVRPVAADDFLLGSTATGRVGRLAVLGSEEASTRLLRGSYDPFGGWVVDEGVPKATASIVVDRPGLAGPTITILALGERGSLLAASTPKLEGRASADGWAVELDAVFGAEAVRWNGTRLTVDLPGQNQVLLTPALFVEEDIAPRVMAVSAFEDAAARHERFPYLLPYRYEVSWAFLAIFFMQELAFAGIRRVRPQWNLALRLFAAIAWVLLGGLAAFVYLSR